MNPWAPSIATNIWLSLRWLSLAAMYRETFTLVSNEEIATFVKRWYPHGGVYKGFSNV